MAIPKTKPFSPLAKTDGITAVSASVIKIDATFNEGIYSFADASVADPGEAVLALNGFLSEDPADYMSITFTERDTVNNELKGVVQTGGTDQSWPSGTEIQANPTAYLLNLLKSNVETIGGKVLPAGGSSGQILKKSSATDYDTAWSVEQDISGKLDKIGGTITDYVETVATDTWDSATEDIDLELANVHSVSITADVTTLTFSNPRAGAHSFTLVIAQGGTLRNITWPVSVAWAGGSAPTMAINKTYWITFVTLNGGTNWTGFLAGEV
jgi:hypothetical protein